MPEFTLHATVLADQPSVTAQLVAWHVPKRYRFWLRAHNAVTVNGAYRYANRPVFAGEQISMHLQADDATTYRLDPGSLDVIYEDPQLLVVNKPAGIKPHPNQPHEGGTLMNRVANYLTPSPAYITHRLDMATSGLTLIAKDPLTQALINQQLAQKQMRRSYVALVPADIPDAGTIDAPIGHDPSDKRKRMVTAGGDHAVTHYRVLSRSGESARLWLTLETGRTHQLRVHLAHIGYPIIGDPLYSPTSAPRLMLHAAALSWQRPFSTTETTVRCPAPF